ncbi:MAG: hypothetical protein AAF682_27790 [Planctomycetota bacterium]
MTTLFATGVLACLASASGTVWIVDDDGGAGVDFTDLPAAVDAAQSGDTILVQDGEYSAFAISGKGLNVIADTGQAPSIGGGVAVQGLAADQVVLLRGLEVANVPGAGGGEGLDLRINQGAVWLEDCTFTGADGFNDGSFSLEVAAGKTGANVEQCADVVFTRCTLTGGKGADILQFFADSSGVGGRGLSVADSTVACWQTSLSGGKAGSDLDGSEFPTTSKTGGDGARLASGLLFLSGSQVTGGQGGAADYFFKGIAFCTSGGAGGAGLALDGGEVRPLDSSFAGGPGGTASALVTIAGCSGGTAGAQIEFNGGLNTPLAGTTKGLQVPAPFRAQVADSIVYEGEAGDAVFLLVGPPDEIAFLDPIAGALALGLTPVTLFAGVVPASGVLTQAASFQAVPGGASSQLLGTQAVFVSATGNITAGASSGAVLLAPGF